MIFVFKAWDLFCKKLSEKGIKSICACDVTNKKASFTVLKHDVETDVSKAYRMAELEHKYGHCGSYYVQAYLLDDRKNIELLRKMQEMGHEISYHYDVMDFCKGDIDKAIEEFEVNKRKFEENGFVLKTLCQHGNPIVERVGYTSNRDFFRNSHVRELYPSLSDIMVNFKDKYSVDYTYYSDAGRKFKMIYDPINNDIVNSDDKNIVYENLEKLLCGIDGNTCSIISTHPHRWTDSALMYVIKTAIFKIVKFVAKLLVKIPFMKKLMSKYFYLAKKI